MQQEPKGGNQLTAIYLPKQYAGWSEDAIAKDAKLEGFAPFHFTNKPGDIYPPHAHPETKLLVFLEGSMEVRVADQLFHCEAGDKLIIPGNMTHEATVGPQGCTFFWSEKME